ncbi:MAG: energy-coupling factor ABC transporter permease [Thiotrichales bacterium]|nr:energy-coupling factor ABC transporter permease [Thiotrichales bacterium]
MDFNSSYFPVSLAVVTDVGMAVLILLVLYGLRDSSHLRPAIINRWLWGVFFLTIIWLMRVTLESGLNMHLSGGMLMVLLYGWRLGLLGICLVNIGICIFADGLLLNIGMAMLFNALIPVSVAYGIFLVLEAALPRHFFIYIFGTAFIGSWISSALTGFCIAVSLAVVNAFNWDILRSEFLPFYFLFGFAEAFLTAGLVTLFVVYRPAWAYSFRDHRYLEDR